MTGRIVLFGATGYTGDLTARALVERGVKPVLAARNEARVRALAEELGGLDWALADVSQPHTVAALVERGDVLISTVGPFARWGQPALQAAIGAGAHYLDSTGETSFIRAVFERFGPQAQAAECALVTAMGYDWVPGNLAGALALRAAGPTAVRVEVGYFVTGSGSGGGLSPSEAMSGGTRASAAGALLDPSYAWRGGRLVTERAARRARTFSVRGRAQMGVSIGTSEHLSLPRVYPNLRDVDVFLGWFGPASRPMQAMSAGLSMIGRVPGVRPGLGAIAAKLVKGSTGGPDATQRAGSRSVVLAEAKDAAGAVLAEVRLEGVNGYDFTAQMLAWGAQTAAAGGIAGTGALGPVEAFGLDVLIDGSEQAGITQA